MNANHRNAITKYWLYALLVAVIGLLSAGHNLTQAQNQNADDTQSLRTIPLGSAGLTYSEAFRTTLTNLSNRLINAEVRILDADGTVLRQESVALEPNQIRATVLSRGEMGRGEISKLVRAEVVVAQGDAPKLWLTGEVVNRTTGSTQFLTTSTSGPLQGSNQNHNETLVLDPQN